MWGENRVDVKNKTFQKRRKVEGERKLCWTRSRKKRNEWKFRTGATESIRSVPTRPGPGGGYGHAWGETTGGNGAHTHTFDTEGTPRLFSKTKEISRKTTKSSANAKKENCRGKAATGRWWSGRSGRKVPAADL